MRDHDEETFEQPIPTVEDMRPFVGKVIAFDRAGNILESADSWGQLIEKVENRLDELTLMHIPETSTV